MSDDMKFDHLGLVVKSTAKGRKVLAQMLAIKHWTVEFHDPINGVLVQFGHDQSGMCYELLEPLNEESPVYSALTTGKAIINHVAYRVPNIVAHGERLRGAGCAPTSNPKPAVAYGGRQIQFFFQPAPVHHRIGRSPGPRALIFAPAARRRDMTDSRAM